MSKLTTTFLAAVKSFNGSKDNPASPDKNGNMPVLLHPVAGSCPDKRIIAGTVALNEGMQINKTYLISCVETDTDEEFGRQFNFTVIAEASIMEIMQAPNFLGQPSLIPVMEEGEAAPQEDEVVLDENGDVIGG
jgi:hypothetical protein